MKLFKGPLKHDWVSNLKYNIAKALLFSIIKNHWLDYDVVLKQFLKLNYQLYQEADKYYGGFERQPEYALKNIMFTDLSESTNHTYYKIEKLQKELEETKQKLAERSL